MNITYLLWDALIPAVATMIVAALAKYLWDAIKSKVRGKSTEPLYSERLGKLTSRLLDASKDVDLILREVEEVTRAKHASLQQMEGEIGQMKQREVELKEKITALSSVTIPAAEHFAQLIKSNEKRSARRDYLLFGLGVLVTTIIAVLVQVLMKVPPVVTP